MGKKGNLNTTKKKLTKKEKKKQNHDKLFSNKKHHLDTDGQDNKDNGNKKAA